MADIHIDEFYHDCSKALVILYNAFPRLITLYVDDLINDSETDEYGIPTRRHKACFDALLWLAEEGYLRYQSRINQNALDQVTLTEKSFCRLNRPSTELTSRVPAAEKNTTTQENHLPAAIASQRKTLVWFFREAINEGSSTKFNLAFTEFLNIT